MDNKIGTIRAILEQNGKGIIFAYLFGSLAKGEKIYPPKDIDIAVFVEKNSYHSYHDAKIDIYAILSRSLKTNDIDIVVLNAATNLILLDEIIRHGILLLDKDPVSRENFELKILHQALDFKLQRARMGMVNL